MGFKYPPEVRKFLREKQRGYRAKKKAKLAEAAKHPANLAQQPPPEEAAVC